MVNLKFSTKKLNLKKNSNFKNPKRSFVRAIGRKIHSAAICWSSVFKFSRLLGPMLSKTKKKYIKISILKISNILKVKIIRNKIQEKFENFRL